MSGYLVAFAWRIQGDGLVGTHPADRINPGAIDTAARHQLPLPRLRHIGDVLDDGDLVVTVCDQAHEEIGGLAAPVVQLPTVAMP